VRLRTRLDDVCLVGEPVEHGLAEPCVGEELGQFREGQLVVTMTAAFSARSAMTWKSSSAATLIGGRGSILDPLDFDVGNACRIERQEALTGPRKTYTYRFGFSASEASRISIRQSKFRVIMPRSIRPLPSLMECNAP
jgi:hypothetical protein